MPEMERIKEYNRTVLHKPIPSDFSIVQVAKDYYGVAVDLDDTEKIKRMRHWLYDSKQTMDGPASINIQKKKDSYTTQKKMDAVQLN